MMAERLDRRITVQRRTKSTDNAGDVTFTWSDQATVWADVKENRGSEEFDASRKHDEQEYVFEIRFKSVTPKLTDRIKYDGELYDIRFVKEIKRRQGWKIIGRRKWHT